MTLILGCTAAVACGGAGSEPRQGKVTVTVSPALAEAFSSLGATQTYHATVRDTLGDSLTQVVTWKVVNAGSPAGVGDTTVKVSTGGVVSVGAGAVPGDWKVIASAGDTSDTATMRVLAPPTGKLVVSVVLGANMELFVKDFAIAGPPVEITGLASQIAGFAVDQGSGTIFFSQGRLPNADIFSITTAGTGLTNLTHDSTASNQGPSIDPITHDVYFSRHGLGDTATQVFRMGEDGSNLTQVTTGAQSKIQPAVSPDGTSLAWDQLFEPGNDQEIVTSAIDGSNPAQLTNRAGIDSSAFWISNSRVLWSYIAPGSSSDVFGADLASPAAFTNLTNGAGQSSQPSTGCEPNTVTIVRSINGVSNAYQLDLTTGAVAPYSLIGIPGVTFARRFC